MVFWYFFKVFENLGNFGFWNFQKWVFPPKILPKLFFKQRDELDLEQEKAVTEKEAAIEAAKKSLVGAQAAGNADYVKMNTESLQEWAKM